MFRESLFVVIVYYALCTNAANILFLNILPSRSHLFWNGAISNALAARGHNITMIAPEIDKHPPSGVHYIHSENLNDGYQKYNKEKFMQKVDTNPFSTALKTHFASIDICKRTLESNGFQILSNYSNDFNFDLVLYDFTMGPCLLPFLHKFNYPPLVSVTAFSHPSYLVELVGGHHYYSYVPHNVFSYEKDMTFWQRFLNFAVYLEEYLYRQYYFYPQIDALVEKHFGANLPSVAELQQRTLIALISTNPAIDYAESLPKNVIPVGGLHIKDAKPLPSDLENFVNASQKGVVLFSLGTNVRSDFISIEKQMMFIETFRQLPEYHFLWKFESNCTLTQLPSNVRVLPWLPQSDILAHKKMKAIIAHGGSLSTQEAVWRGIPMLVIPLALDQIRNAIRTKRLGVSETIDYHTVTKSEFKTKLVETLENPTYTTNAKILSKRFKDQKEKPLDRAVWYIEWALRNPGGNFMASPVLRLGLFAGNSFDVIAVFAALLLMISFVVLWIVFKTTRTILNGFVARNISRKKHD